MFRYLGTCNLRHMATVGQARSNGIPPEDHDLSVLVVRLFDRVKQSIREVGDDMGLTPAQLDVLRQLQERGPTPMRRMAEILGCEASNLTGLVDKLEARE